MLGICASSTKGLPSCPITQGSLGELCAKMQSNFKSFSTCTTEGC